MIELVNKKSNVNLSTPTIITGGGTTDLSNYYTKAEVDALIPDIMPLSSIGEISGPSVKGIWTIKIDIAQFFGQYAHYNYYSDHLYANLVVKYNGEIKLFAMNHADQSYDMKILCKGNVVTLSCLDVLRTFTLESGGSISLTTYKFARDTDVLAKNNTTEYIPSHDYNPATKKYVDNAVDNIDLSGYALKSEVPKGDTVKHISINSSDELLGLENGLYWLDNNVSIETEDGVNSFGGLMIVYSTTFIFLTHGAFADYDIETKTWHCDLYAIYSDGFLTEEQVMALIPDVSGFALKSEIPDVSSYTTMNAVEAKGYQTEAQVQALINSALGVIENGTY